MKIIEKKKDTNERIKYNLREMQLKQHRQTTKPKKSRRKKTPSKKRRSQDSIQQTHAKRPTVLPLDHDRGHRRAIKIVILKTTTAKHDQKK